MTKAKLEYFQKMYEEGILTKDEIRDIEHTYEFQDYSFIEINGKKEVLTMVRPRSYEDDPYADAAFEEKTVFDEETPPVKPRKSGSIDIKGMFSEFSKALEEFSKLNKG